VKNPQRTVPRDAIVDHDDDAVMVSIAPRAGVYRARCFRRTSSCACFSTSRYESSNIETVSRQENVSGFVEGQRSIAQPISYQRVLGFQTTWPLSFFVFHPAWKTLVSLLLFDIRIRRCHYKLIPSLLLKYGIRLGILSQMGICHPIL
jgi:hypothetical protein